MSAQRHFVFRVSATLLLGVLVTIIASAQTRPWVSAYYAGWWQGGRLNPDEIDYSAVTHIIHFALIVKEDGTVTGVGNGLSPDNILSAVHAAHNAGKKILVSIGGAFSDANFASATQPSSRDRFIRSLIEVVHRYSYDGIDVDWEPLRTLGNYVQFVKELRAALDAMGSGKLMITACGEWTDNNLLLRVARYYDQINLMTYDMSGAYPGWIVWHNTPLYNKSGLRFPSTGGSLPSIEVAIQSKLEAGIPAGKIGIGIDFYGYRWYGGTGTPTGGVTAPGQAWVVPPTVKDNVPYFQLMETYVRYPVQWDATAEASFISIDRPGSADDEFISFDDEQTIRSKANYIKRTGLGGVILYDLGAGYRRNLPNGYRDLLLQSVKHEFLGGPPPRKETAPPVVRINAPRSGATLKGTVTVECSATDAHGVNCIILSVDGTQIGDPLTAAPYSVSLNTWKLENGNHTISAAAFDQLGNRSQTNTVVNVMNVGQPPLAPVKTVFDDELRQPFVNTSWGAVVNWKASEQVRDGSFAAQVNYSAWGAFDMLSGTWGVEQQIDPADYEALAFDVFPQRSMELKVAFYGPQSKTVRVEENRWNSVTIPLAFSDKFTRFYIQSVLNQPAICYFDNIRFLPRALAPR